jgi:hypothetical protein
MQWFSTFYILHLSDHFVKKLQSLHSKNKDFLLQEVYVYNYVPFSIVLITNESS